MNPPVDCSQFPVARFLFLDETTGPAPQRLRTEEQEAADAGAEREVAPLSTGEDSFSAVPAQDLPLTGDKIKLMRQNMSECQKLLSELEDYDAAKSLELEKFKAEQSQENQLLKEQIAKLAEDKKTLEERNKSLQEKNKSISKNHKDDLEKFGKMLKDADKQLVEAMTQIKNMAEEKDLWEKELGELKAAAQAVIDMVDPPKEGAVPDKTLLERLQGTPRKIVKYLSDTSRQFDTSRQYVSHVLRVVKSYWPQVNLTPLGEGMSVECSEERFADFVEGARPVADKIVDILEQEPVTEP